MLVDQHDDLAAGRRAAIVQLQVVSLVLVTGGRAVAGGEGEAVDANNIRKGVASLWFTAAPSQEHQHYRHCLHVYTSTQYLHEYDRRMTL